MRQRSRERERGERESLSAAIWHFGRPVQSTPQHNQTFALWDFGWQIIIVAWNISMSPDHTYATKSCSWMHLTFGYHRFGFMRFLTGVSHSVTRHRLISGMQNNCNNCWKRDVILRGKIKKNLLVVGGVSNFILLCFSAHDIHGKHQMDFSS